MLYPSSRQGGGGGGNSEIQLLSPLPGPSGPSKGAGTKISSPDSVFNHEDSVSSDECKSVPERTPSPEGSATTPPPPPTLVDGLVNEGGRRGEGMEEVEDGGEGEREMARGSGSPQNTLKISEFHKSLSDLAHSFSTLLIPEDEQNVLKSAG